MMGNDFFREPYSWDELVLTAECELNALMDHHFFYSLTKSWGWYKLDVVPDLGGVDDVSEPERVIAGYVH